MDTVMGCHYESKILNAIRIGLYASAELAHAICMYVYVHTHMYVCIHNMRMRDIDRCYTYISKYIYFM